MILEMSWISRADLNSLMLFLEGNQGCIFRWISHSWEIKDNLAVLWSYRLRIYTSHHIDAHTRIKGVLSEHSKGCNREILDDGCSSSLIMVLIVRCVWLGKKDNRNKKLCRFDAFWVQQLLCYGMSCFSVGKCLTMKK